MKRIRPTHFMSDPPVELIDPPVGLIDPPTELIDPLREHLDLLPFRRLNTAWRRGLRVPCEEDFQEVDRSEECDDVYEYSMKDPPGRIQAKLLCQMLKQKFNT